MQAALHLSWFKLKSTYGDFIKVLLGILLFEGLIIYIQDDGFMKNFETSRMTLFLLLFSASLLILVQNSIYISKEYAILQRDFFSGLSRLWYGIASLLYSVIFSIIETFVFLLGYKLFTVIFDKNIETKGYLVHFFWLELFITVVLLFMCSHFLALFVSASVGANEITSIILSVVIGIMQFSLSGTILQLPKSIKSISSLIFLGYSHKLFGMTNAIKKLPSAMAKFKIPIDPEQLKQFKPSSAIFISDWFILLLHACIYAILFIIMLHLGRKR